MTPQEKDLIAQLFDRLPAANEPKDAEAGALIRDRLRERPDAPYFLAQTILIQEMALAQAQQRIQELEHQLGATQAAASPQQPTSFLGRAFRGSAPAPASAPPAGGPWGSPSAAPPAGPVWSQTGGAPAAAAPMTSPGMAPMPWGTGGGGFLRQAATTAAGVAGGALLFEGIQSLFGPHYGNILGGMPMQPGISETVINNYYDDQQAPGSDLQQTDYSPDDPNAGNDQDFADNQDYGNDQDFGGGDDGNFNV